MIAALRWLFRIAIDDYGFAMFQSQVSYVQHSLGSLDRSADFANDG